MNTFLFKFASIDIIMYVFFKLGNQKYYNLIKKQKNPLKFHLTLKTMNFNWRVIS